MLTIDGVDYDCDVSKCNQSVIVHSNYFNDLLTVRSRVSERYAGFQSENGFVYVDSTTGGTVEFTCCGGITIDVVADWFRDNLTAIQEIGYEVLGKIK